MAIDRELFDRVVNEVAAETAKAEFRDAMAEASKALGGSPVIMGIAIEQLAKGSVSGALQAVGVMAFLAGRSYEVAAALAKVAVDSGEKAT